MMCLDVHQIHKIVWVSIDLEIKRSFIISLGEDGKENFKAPEIVIVEIFIIIEMSNCVSSCAHNYLSYIDFIIFKPIN